MNYDFLEERQEHLNRMVEGMVRTVSESGHADNFIFACASGCIFDLVRYYKSHEIGPVRHKYQIKKKHLIGAMQADLRFSHVDNESCSLDTSL